MNERDDSDRFIPIRVCDETINEIFNIPQKTFVNTQKLNQEKPA